MPQIDKKIEDLKLDISILPTREEVNQLREDIKHLPTKKQYYAREDRTMGELKKLREEVSLTGHHYERTNNRVDIIDKHLGIDTSTVF